MSSFLVTPSTGVFEWHTPFHSIHSFFFEKFVLNSLTRSSLSLSLSLCIYSLLSLTLSLPAYLNLLFNFLSLYLCLSLSLSSSLSQSHSLTITSLSCYLFIFLSNSLSLSLSVSPPSIYFSMPVSSIFPLLPFLSSTFILPSNCVCFSVFSLSLSLMQKCQ